MLVEAVVSVAQIVGGGAHAGAPAASAAATQDEERGRTLAVMAPLYLGESFEDARWHEFREQLRAAKRMGITAVTTDIWWGLVQRGGPQSFDWGYYDRLATEIRAAGLEWIPILAIHSCGGNVGDSVNIPIPNWIWNVAGRERSLRFRSEAGNESNDYVSFWDTPAVLKYYRSFFESFRDRYVAEAQNIPEIIVSAGPSGEIHYPAYHAHDRGVAHARYPDRGTLQASSETARRDFRAKMLQKYGSVEAINRVWGTNVKSIDDIAPPTAPGAVTWLVERGLGLPYARDLFDWYRDTLVTHVKLLGEMTAEVFANKTWDRKLFSFKLPGTHWRMNTRAAELTSGLISPSSRETWNRVDLGFGYRELFDALRSVSQRLGTGSRLGLYFTAGATPNGQDGEFAASRAEDLARATAELARAYGFVPGVENALDSDLYNFDRLELLKRVLNDGLFDHVALLRIGDVVRGERLAAWLKAIRRNQCADLLVEKQR